MTLRELLLANKTRSYLLADHRGGDTPPTGRAGRITDAPTIATRFSAGLDALVSLEDGSRIHFIRHDGSLGWPIASLLPATT